MILEVTANANGGLCAPCSKGGGLCEACGARLSQPNKSGKFICYDCEKSQRFESVPSLPKQWTKPVEVDWQVVANNYALAIDSLLRLFLAAQGDDPAYGVVFQLSQNGMLDVHINTQDGIGEIPSRMRKIANWGQELSDDEWVAKVGLWFTPAWKYADLSSIFGNEVARAINDFHYDLFEMLCDSDEGDDDSEDMAKIDRARLSAIESVSSSDAFRSIARTQGFTAHVVDDDGLDYETGKRIGD